MKVQTRADYRLGDPVWVEHVTFDGREKRTVQVPATVMYNRFGQIGVAYANGTRQMLGSHHRLVSAREIPDA